MTAVEETEEFQPRYDANGLIPAIVTDSRDGAVLMFAWMNAEALMLTLKTRTVHFWSRSRKAIWKKGETSGETLALDGIRTDCDQDVLLMNVTNLGTGKACHTGRRTCFYRRLRNGRLAFDGPAE